ncbi:MAG: DcrB-related protein [Candidatus Eisenbacteria bacterium]|nr:DcrB-related protein [Candidatus Eisenbacteria bacterium]
MTTVRIGGWLLPVVPKGWDLIESHGIRRTGKGVFPSNASFTEEPLPGGKDLAGYVQDQVTALRGMIPEVEVAEQGPSTFPDSDEALQLVLRFGVEGRPIVQRQVYVRRGDMIGILTLTTTEDDFKTVRDTFDRMRESVRYCPEPSSHASAENSAE